MIKIIHSIINKKSKSIIKNSLNVTIYKTHNGNGSTSQYENYPLNQNNFDKLFDISFSNTTLFWNGNLNTTPAINFSNYTSLTNAGASVPISGEYFSLKAVGVFIPKETGSYSFLINSDDGSDLLIEGTNVVNYYGGHGMTNPQYGSINLVANQRYSFIARMQEYGGGEGLQVKWSKPSNTSVYSVDTDEIGREI